MFLQYFKNILEVSHMFGHHLTLYHHIIYINLNILAQLWLKHLSHHSLIGRPCILQTKRYHLVVVISSRSDKNCLLLITQGQWYLMVSLEGIYKAHSRMVYSCIHWLVYLRYREMVFWTDLIQIREVHTYLPFSTLIFHHYSIS